MKELWIIGIANSEGDGIDFQKVLGTVDEVKNHLVSMIKADKANDEENYDYGSDDIDDITEYYINNDDSNKIYLLEGYATYSVYHIDYTAILASEITEIE